MQVRNVKKYTLLSKNNWNNNELFLPHKIEKYNEATVFYTETDGLAWTPLLDLWMILSFPKGIYQ